MDKFSRVVLDEYERELILGPECESVPEHAPEQKKSHIPAGRRQVTAAEVGSTWRDNRGPTTGNKWSASRSGIADQNRRIANEFRDKVPNE